MTKQCSNCKWVRAERIPSVTIAGYRDKGYIESTCTYEAYEVDKKATDCCSKWEYFDSLPYKAEILVYQILSPKDYKRFSPAYDGLKGVIL